MRLPNWKTVAGVGLAAIAFLKQAKAYPVNTPNSSPSVFPTPAALPLNVDLAGTESAAQRSVISSITKSIAPTITSDAQSAIATLASLQPRQGSNVGQGDTGNNNVGNNDIGNNNIGSNDVGDNSVGSNDNNQSNGKVSIVGNGIDVNSNGNVLYNGSEVSVPQNGYVLVCDKGNAGLVGANLNGVSTQNNVLTVGGKSFNCATLGNGAFQLDQSLNILSSTQTASSSQEPKKGSSGKNAPNWLLMTLAAGGTVALSSACGATRGSNDPRLENLENFASKNLSAPIRTENSIGRG